MVTVRPEAISDTLILGDLLQKRIEDFAEAEIQFFSYFACLLSLYDGNTVEKWNYRFIKSSIGGPYSEEVRKSFDTLIGNKSMIKNEDGYYNITANGIQSVNFYRTQRIINWRVKYLETACKSLSLVPYGHVKKAIAQEPVMHSANNSIISKNLLENDNPSTKALYQQFSSLRKALSSEYKSLIAPAVVWLEALNDQLPETI